jgi:hypothetical protein
MRVIAWNVAHQETGRKQYENVVSESGTIPRLIVSADRLVGALVAMKADVAFLTEYRRSQSQQDDEDLELARAGFKVERTVVVPRLLPAESKKRDNQTLVAACQRKPILIVKSAAENAPEYALDNYCHVVRSGVDLVGLRIPAYQGSTKEIVAQNETHWQWLDRTLKPLVRSRSIVLGDMNRDPDSPDTLGVTEIAISARTVENTKVRGSTTLFSGMGLSLMKCMYSILRPRAMSFLPDLTPLFLTTLFLPSTFRRQTICSHGCSLMPSYPAASAFVPYVLPEVRKPHSATRSDADATAKAIRYLLGRRTR